MLADFPPSQSSLTKVLAKRATAQIHFPTPQSDKGFLPLGPGFQLVCLADMVAGSGALEVLWAYSMVRLAGWPCTLWMAGEGPLLEEYQQFARLASVPEGIHFLPHFRSFANLPVDPDLVLVPRRAYPWENYDQHFRHHPKITAQTNGTKEPNTMAISWKPHLLCRSILTLLEAHGTPKAQVSTPLSRQNFPQMMDAIATFVRLKNPGQSP